MRNDVPRQDEGFDIVINGVNRLFADMELSAIASAGFHKKPYPEDTVQIRTRADGTLRTMLGHAVGRQHLSDKMG
jgi:hypothetical protein